MLLTLSVCASEYVLIQEDSIKLGKKGFYEEQKRKGLPKEVLGLEDLENPQMVYLLPLKGLEDLAGLLEGKKEPLIDTCLHFQVFSLHRALKELSLGDTLQGKAPYILYAVYEVALGGEEAFESMLAGQVKKGKGNFATWKSLIAGDTPKYVIASSFASKEDLEEAKMEEILDESSIRGILRGKKTGWMKRSPSLSRGSIAQ